ncbi:formin BNR1 PWA37_001132 [Arxiozyma heterogenica]|uniref:FH2 domain-containing protein n=1 Tax=Arxiozyma heterogenica TaxID=278026 RepID=A0AAN7WKL0_9SACH|nr:hypothetical protein RI543_004657 [Kazachstania heterogenica]
MNDKKRSTIINEINTVPYTNNTKFKKRLYSFKLRNKSDSNLLKKSNQIEDIKEEKGNSTINNGSIHNNNKDNNSNINEDTSLFSSDTVNGWLCRELEVTTSNWDLFSEDYITSFLHQWERQLRYESNVQYFVQNNQTVLHKFISELIPYLINNMKWEFIVLNCFQSIFKYFLKYPEIMNILLIRDETDSKYPWFQWILSIINRGDNFQSIKLRCHALLLLLQLFDFNFIPRNFNVNEIIWNIIQDDLSLWIQQLNELLVIASSPISINNSINKIVHLGRVNELIPKFILLSLDLFINLINSFHSITTKYIILKQLKINKIHDFFYQLDSLRDALTFDLSQINQKIRYFKDIEKTILLQKNQTVDDSLFNQLSTYNKDLTFLLERTDNTPLQTHLNDIFDHLVKFIDKNPYDESINLFKSINYISNYFNLENNDKPNSNLKIASDKGFKDYIEKLMDNLQSDEIAKRAMEQLRQSKVKIQKLTLKLESLQDLTILQNDNNMVLQELKQANLLLDEKDNDLESLTLQNRRLEDQLRKLNNEIERINTHQRWYTDQVTNNMKNHHSGSYNSNTKSHSTLFETMKNPFNKKRDIQALQRKSSMKSSQRINSLSSILKQSDNRTHTSTSNDNPFPQTPVNSGHHDLNNQIGSARTDSTILNTNIISQPKSFISTPYKTSCLTSVDKIYLDPKNKSSITTIDTRLNLHTKMSRKQDVNQHKDYETQDCISPTLSRSLPRLSLPTLSAALNSLPQSTPSLVNEPTIFGSRFLTSTSSLLSTDSINDLSMGDNTSLEYSRVNSNSVFNNENNMPWTNGSPINETYYLLRNSTYGLVSNNILNNVSPSIKDNTKVQLLNIDNNTKTETSLNSDSSKTHIPTTVLSAPPLPSNLAIFSNTEKSESFVISSTISESPISLPFAPPPPPPPLPKNLSIISLINEDTNEEKTDMSTETPKGKNTINTEIKTLPAPPPSPPPLPLLFAKAVSSSSKNSNTLIKEETSQSIPLPPPPPPLPSSLKKSDMKESSSVKSPTKSQPNPAALSMALIKPISIRLKQIHWDKIENVSGTLWEDFNSRRVISKELQMNGILTEIEEKFRIKENITLKMKGNNNLNNDFNNGKDSNALNNKSTVSYLSRDLQQQFGINLHMFSNLTVDEFVNKVMNCDNAIIKNVSVLEFFSKEELTNIAPSLVRKYEPYMKDEVKEDLPILERADEIFLKLCYRMRSYWGIRSKCLLVLSTYEKDYYDLIYKLQKIDTAISQLKKSEAFKNILYMIMEIGNYMNVKRVEGIKISSLNKLIFIKSSVDNNNSFLHFIESCIRNKYPELMSFLRDLDAVEDMGRTTIDQLELECNEYCAKINSMYYSVTRGKLSNPDDLDPRDQILKKVKYKTNRAKNKSDLLKDRLELTLSDMEELVKYYGEDYKDVEVRNKFFQQFIEFIQLFKKCNKENVEKEEMERLYNERNKSQILIDGEEVEEEKVGEKSTKEGNEISIRKIDILLTKLRDVEKIKNRTSRHDISDIISNNKVSENNKLVTRKKRDEKKLTSKIKQKDANYNGNNNEKHHNGNDADDKKPALLKRAQTMLNNIQNI